MKKYTILLSVIDENKEPTHKLFVVYGKTLKEATEKVKKYAGEYGWQMQRIVRYSEELSK